MLHLIVRKMLTFLSAYLGLCSPRFMHSAIYNVPTTAEMLKQTSVPFALAISPFARLHEDEVCVFN